MNKLKRLWATFFGISAGEYSGFRLLIFTAVICLVGLATVNYITKSPYSNYEKDAKHLDSLLAIMQKVKSPQPKVSQPIVLVAFDPNLASEEKLLQVGFPSWLAKRLLNYRNAGGRFKKPEELLKLYDFPDSLYKQLVDYIVIEQAPKPKSKPNPTYKPKENRAIAKVEEKLPVFDLNAADTAIFQTIRGIGSKLSNRIVSYRTSLGGFVSKNQLHQIYRLDSSVIEKLINSSIISSDFVPSQLDINNYTKEQLSTHPYLNWNQAKLIVAYRNQHGSFNSQQDLLKVYSINENWIKKIAPYLTFQKGSP